jgi:23S rRNA pseudouridine1911/1915/1917 synthase
MKGISPMLRGDALKLLKLTDRQMLHAELLGFVHPVTGERFRWESGLPEDMKTVLGMLEGQ